MATFALAGTVNTLLFSVIVVGTPDFTYMGFSTMDVTPAPRFGRVMEREETPKIYLRKVGFPLLPASGKLYPVDTVFGFAVGLYKIGFRL